MSARENQLYDVIVAGGGAAGLSAALTLARARRSVLVIDAGDPLNAPAEGVHALLGLDGIHPRELLERGRAEVTGYGGEITSGAVTEAARHEDGFTITLGGDGSLRSRRLIIATGLTDVLPDIPGVAEQWGRSVLHCPYCHGWEVRDQPIGVLATGPMSVHQALLFRQWSADIRYFTNGGEVTDDERLQLDAHGVGILDGAVAGVWVAGNATDLFAQVGASAADGARAAAHVNADLVTEDTARAVAAARTARELSLR